MKKLALLILGALLLFVVGMVGASADSGNREYQYLLGTGFLCDLDPSACPDIAMANNGDTVELTGSGTLTIHPKSVTGEGDFTHNDSEGNELASGTWTALELQSFQSYGTQEGLPPEVEGGHAVILVQLFVGGNPVATAILTVDCAIGKFPPGHTEGIKLNVQDLLNFNKKVSGFTVFIRQ